MNQTLLTAIDVGSAKTCALVAEITDAGLRYAGTGFASRAARARASSSIWRRRLPPCRKRWKQAEDVAGAPVEHAVVGDRRSAHSRPQQPGWHPLGSRAREITREDIRQPLSARAAMALPPDRQILHLLPQEFILDEQPGIREPAGMMAASWK